MGCSRLWKDRSKFIASINPSKLRSPQTAQPHHRVAWSTASMVSYKMCRLPTCLWPASCLCPPDYSNPTLPKTDWPEILLSRSSLTTALRKGESQMARWLADREIRRRDCWAARRDPASRLTMEKKDKGDFRLVVNQVTNDETSPPDPINASWGVRKVQAISLLSFIVRPDG